jgi:hypothetical protein
MPTEFAGANTRVQPLTAQIISRSGLLQMHMIKMQAKKSPVSRAQLRMLLGRLRRDQL